MKSTHQRSAIKIVIWAAILLMSTETAVNGLGHRCRRRSGGSCTSASAKPMTCGSVCESTCNVVSTCSSSCGTTSLGYDAPFECGSRLTETVMNPAPISIATSSCLPAVAPVTRCMPVATSVTCCPPAAPTPCVSSCCSSCGHRCGARRSRCRSGCGHRSCGSRRTASCSRCSGRRRCRTSCRSRRCGSRCTSTCGGSTPYQTYAVTSSSSWVAAANPATTKMKLVFTPRKSRSSIMPNQQLRLIAGKLTAEKLATITDTASASDPFKTDTETATAVATATPKLQLIFAPMKLASKSADAHFVSLDVNPESTTK